MIFFFLNKPNPIVVLPKYNKVQSNLRQHATVPVTLFACTDGTRVTNAAAETSSISLCGHMLKCNGAAEPSVTPLLF